MSENKKETTLHLYGASKHPSEKKLSSLLRRGISGIALIVSAQTGAGSMPANAEEQYIFPKASDWSLATPSAIVNQKSLNSNSSTNTKSKKNSSASSNNVTPSTNQSSSSVSKFQPDFDGSGGRGPAVNVANDRSDNNLGYYKSTRAYRLEPEPDVPPYVLNLAKTYPEFRNIDWLNVGLDSRVRFEDRENSYLPRTNDSGFGPTNQRMYYPYTPFLARSRLYLGVKDVLDPLRFVFEFQDSRAYDSLYSLQGQDVNQTELIQGFAELYLKDALGKDPKGQGRAISIRAGRMAFEVGSRRLISRNEFRNTTNNFEGFRLLLGEHQNDVDLDSFLMRPVIRYPNTWDRPEWNNWIYGSFLSIRNISPYFTLQPYFVGRHQYGDPLSSSGAFKVKRDTQAPGMRIYGNYNNFDWDLDVMKQFGTIGTISTTYPDVWGYTNISSPFGGYAQTKQHDAIAYGFEAGYTFADHPWKPRLSGVFIYGSGNKSPWSSANNNVDTFYGFNQPFSRNDYIGWNNVKDPKIRVEFEPFKNTKIDTAFSAYWLASAAAAWDRVDLYAPLGNRGTFIGTEWDFRVRQKLSQYVNISASYARFWPGSFASSFAPPTAQQWPPTAWPGGTVPGQTGSTNGITGKPSNFFYFEATANAFGDGKPIANIPGSSFMAYWDDEEKMVRQEPSWKDVYVGLVSGGSIANSSMKVQNIGASGTDVTSVRNDGIALTTLNVTPTTYNQQLKGFIGGLTVGANYKLGKSFVSGLESDLVGTAGNIKTNWTLSNVGPSNYTTYGQHSSILNYLGTVRGRLGYLAMPELLIFGTAGFAYGGITSSNSYITISDSSPGSPTVFGPQVTTVLTGWTAGGGVELALSTEWSAKADYLYYNLGSTSAWSAGSNQTYTPYVPQVNYSNGWGQFSTSVSSYSGSIIRGGLNRHFDFANSAANSSGSPVLAKAIGGASTITIGSSEAKPVKWSGAYAGLNIGSIWSNQNSINNITDWPASNQLQYVASSAWLSGDIPASGSAAFIGGAQIGYNAELEKVSRFNLLVGLETDFQGVVPGGSKGTNTFVTVLPPAASTGQALISQSATNSLSYIGTTRGRAGLILTPSILVYGTGGVAYGNANTSLQTFAGLGSLGGWQGGSSSQSSTQLGWTAGGGVEWKFRENWSVKGEYLYYDLGKTSGRVNNYAYTSSDTGVIASQSNYNQRFSGNILRAGLNYHLTLEKPGPLMAGY